MDGLIEFLSANFFIVIAIVVGLMSFLKDRSGKQEDEQQRPAAPNRQTPPPTSTPSGPTRVERPNVDTRETSIETFQQSQREALAKRMRVDPSGTEENTQHSDLPVSHIGSARKSSSSRTSEHKRALQKQFKSHLTGKGIISGVVMSEVLGPPRAQKPYRSVTRERKERF